MPSVVSLAEYCFVARNAAASYAATSLTGQSAKSSSGVTVGATVR